MSLPVTLLAGPSTSLRDDLVRCLALRRPRLVAIRYDLDHSSSELRLARHVVDAAGTHQHEVLELTGCCLSCTVRGDLGDALDLVAGSGRWDEAVLALPAGLEPALIAHALNGESAFHLDTVTTVVDALLLRGQLGGDDLLADRGLAAAPTDRRSTAELVLRQLEQADVLAIAELHRVGTEAARTLESLLSHLAPLAAQVALGPGGVGSDGVVTTGRHDPAVTPHQRRQLASLAAELCPETCGVTTLRWQADGPLHSPRLQAALGAIIDGVVRSRGHLWLLDRPRQRIRWESAGASLAFGDPEPWQQLPGCELELTGVGLDAEALRARLDACLVDEDELLIAPSWDDPFEDALGPADSPAAR